MKRIINTTLILAFTMISLLACSQDQKPASPAMKATGKSGAVNINISYGSPAVKGRKVWGELVPYGKVWRTGANDATVIELSADVKVEGQPLAKGSYSLFTIPEESEWTIIFNKKPKQWGAYSYKQDDDVLRVKVKPGKSASFNESLNISVADGKVYILWEIIDVPISIK
jgi:hypothetical protein